jgi:hypothetical protein
MFKLPAPRTTPWVVLCCKRIFDATPKQSAKASVKFNNPMEEKGFMSRKPYTSHVGEGICIKMSKNEARNHCCLTLAPSLWCTMHGKQLVEAGLSMRQMLQTHIVTAC